MDSDLQASKSGSQNLPREDPGLRPHEFRHSITPGVLLIVVSMATILLLGIAVLCFVTATEAGRRFQKKLDRIGTGEVKPELLYVRKKHIGRDMDGDYTYSVTLKDGHGQNATEESVSKGFYEILDAGDVVVGYHYPEGYFIPPESLGKVTIGMETMRWIFAGIPISVSSVILILYFAKWRKGVRPRFSRG